MRRAVTTRCSARARARSVATPTYTTIARLWACLTLMFQLPLTVFSKNRNHRLMAERHILVLCVGREVERFVRLKQCVGNCF